MINNTPLISIIVPVYNVEKYIERCIDSILAQTYTNFELILVDDGTPDNSGKICDEYALRDSRIKVFHEINKGPMWARKIGYMAAIGDYITFCDSDDLLPNNSIQILYEKALETDADIVSGDMQLLFDNGSTKSFSSNLSYGNDKSGVFHALLCNEYSHNLCGKLFRANLLQNYNYITLDNHTNGEDGMLFYQVIEHVNKVEHVNKNVYIYYQNSQSSTHVKLKEIALIRLVEFYNYVANIKYNNNKLNYLAICYSTRCINEFALNQGYSKLKSIVNKHGTHPYLNFSYRLKYMTGKQNLRWYAKYILNLFN